MSATKDLIFVEVALRKGAIDPTLLRQAVTSQAEMGRFGITRPIGAILAEKQPALRATVTEIVRELAEYSIRCPRCKEPAAVSSADRMGQILCAGCEAPIAYTEERISEDDLSTTLVPKGQKHPGGKKRSREIPKPDASRGAAPRFPPEGRTAEKKAPNKAAGPASPPSPVEGSPWAEVTKFRIEKLIAGSPSGKLYRMGPSGELGALKVIDRTLCADKVQLKRWIDYMQLAQDLPRSSMLKPAQLFREGSLTYIVRAYLEGSSRSARAALQGDEPLRGQRVAGFATHLLTSLLSFHSVNLTHGNLTPENVLLTGEGACLTDPGLWILVQGLPGEERVLRSWERSRYHAPEVLRGGEPTPTSDIYSAGRILEDFLGKAGEPPDPAIQQLVERMVEDDPIHRYPSAREALWDLRSGAAPRRGSAPAAGPGPAGPPAAAADPARGPGGARAQGRGARAGKVVIASRAALGVVVLALLGQTASWYETRQAIASPHRADQVGAMLIEEQIASLGRKTAEPAARIAEVERSWKALQDLLRGTAWEERAREAARAPLEEAARRKDAESRGWTAAARARVDAGEWAAALAILLSGDIATLSPEAREVLAKAADGLYQNEGMVCIPGSHEPQGPSRPFLIDAGLLTKAAAGKPGGKDPGPGGAEEPEPAAGLSHGAVKEIAAGLGKRLPTGREWDRAAHLARTGLPRELGAGRIARMDGPLFQWVEDDADDELARAGFGFLRGGNRPGVPPTHPLRRKKSASYPDVGARLARDLPAVPAAP